MISNLILARETRQLAVDALAVDYDLVFCVIFDVLAFLFACAVHIHV
jgi:hypothetical protein